MEDRLVEHVEPPDGWYFNQCDSLTSCLVGWNRSSSNCRGVVSTNGLNAERWHLGDLVRSTWDWEISTSWCPIVWLNWILQGHPWNLDTANSPGPASILLAWHTQVWWVCQTEEFQGEFGHTRRTWVPCPYPWYSPRHIHIRSRTRFYSQYVRIYIYTCYTVPRFNFLLADCAACLTMMLDLKVFGCIHQFTILFTCRVHRHFPGTEQEAARCRYKNQIRAVTLQYEVLKTEKLRRTGPANQCLWVRGCFTKDAGWWSFFDPQERSEWVLGLSHTILLIIDSLLPLA